VESCLRAGCLASGPLPGETGREYDLVAWCDELEIAGLASALRQGAASFEVRNRTRAETFLVRLDVGERHRQILLAGGLLNFVRAQALLPPQRFPGDHAGRYELSQLLYIRPDLVDLSRLDRVSSDPLGRFAQNPDAHEATAEYGRRVIESHIPQRIAASEAEARCFGCNAVVVGRTVVTNTGCDQLARDLTGWGYSPVAVELGEFLKAGGSAKCLTLRLDGETLTAS